MATAHEASSTGYSIRAVHRVCDILDLIQHHPDGFSLGQVVEVTALPKSSAFRYLVTLQERRYVRRDPVTGLFRIGPAFLPLRPQQLGLIAERARTYLRRLRDRFGETVNLGVLEGNRISYVEILESPRSVRLAARVGDRDPLHCTALGKAIASTLDPHQVRAILAAEGMPRRTATTITDLETYTAVLEETRQRGYAVDDRENEEEGRCVAVPLSALGLPASISLSAPASRFPMERVPEVAAALTETSGMLVKDVIGAVAEPGRSGGSARAAASTAGRLTTRRPDRPGG
jgi:IclR family acetate operon transcriptional repressor